MIEACRSCYVRQLRRACDVLGTDDDTWAKALAAAREVLDTFPADDKIHDSAIALGRVWAAAEPILGTRDPYHDQKWHHDEVALGMLERAREATQRAEEPLKQAFAFAAAGNLIDFGPGHPLGDDQLERVYQDALRLTFSIDDSEELLERLRGARRVAYLVDNCGEVVFDRVLIEEILREDPSCEVTVVVRNGPIINDVTLEDARHVGLDEICRVIPSGDPDASAGNVMEAVSDEVREAILGADVVVAKGQGNLEGMRGEPIPGLFFLLRAKCETVSQACGCQEMDLVCMNARRFL